MMKTATPDLHVGFIGLGNVGSKLAGSLVHNKLRTSVLDLDATRMQPLLDSGAARGSNPAQLARDCDIVIACLPSPAIAANVVEGPDGLLSDLTHGTIWA